MTINMTFNSYEEVVEFAKKIAGNTVDSKAIATTVKETKTTKKQEVAAEPTQEEPTELVKEDNPTGRQYSLEDVRVTLGALQKAGKRDQVKELLQSFGAAKLPEVNPDDYPAIMVKAGELDAQ